MLAHPLFAFTASGVRPMLYVTLDFLITASEVTFLFFITFLMVAYTYIIAATAAQSVIRIRRAASGTSLAAIIMNFFFTERQSAEVTLFLMNFGVVAQKSIA